MRMMRTVLPCGLRAAIAAICVCLPMAALADVAPEDEIPPAVPVAEKLERSEPLPLVAGIDGAVEQESAQPKALPAEAGQNPPAKIAWGEAVDGVQIALVPLGGDGGWEVSSLCPRHVRDRHEEPSLEKKQNAIKTRCCEVCGAPKPWCATFVEGKPMAFEVHVRNAGKKNLIVGGVHRWFTFVFTPAGGGVPWQATYTSQVPEAPPGQCDLPGNGYLALVEAIGGRSPSGTWQFEDARPTSTSSPMPIRALSPGKYSVTASYGDHHPEHAPDAPCRFWHGKIATGPVEIEIKPGEPETEAQRQTQQAAEAKEQVERKQQIDRERELKQRAVREQGQ